MSVLFVSLPLECGVAGGRSSRRKLSLERKGKRIERIISMSLPGGPGEYART